MSPFSLFRREGSRERTSFIAQKRQYNGMVRRALRKLRREYAHLRPPLVDHKFFGAPHIDPPNLTIYLIYKHDEALAAAEEQGHFNLLRGAVIAALREECYPQAALDTIEVHFASQRAIKDAGGFWLYVR